MKTNWIEKVWVNGPLRILSQRREMRLFRGFADGRSHERVLEVGCGQGLGIALIRDSLRPRRIDAIDIDPAMVTRAEGRFSGRHSSRGATEIEIRVADAEHLPYPDETMDAVFNFGIIHHLEDWERGISEVARVLRPGGLFYFEELFPELYANLLLRHLLDHPRENRFRGPEYRAALQKAGLELIDGYRESRYTIVGAAARRSGEEAQ